MQKVVWAIVIVIAPRASGQPITACILTNNSSKDRPVITSGITSGATIMPVNRVRPANRPTRASASAASAPSTVAALALITAMRTLSSAASITWSLSSSAAYQRHENPPQVLLIREALKEFSTSSTIGRYKKA